jgi:hypothetical protein
MSCEREASSEDAVSRVVPQRHLLPQLQVSMQVVKEVGVVPLPFPCAGVLVAFLFA